MIWLSNPKGLPTQPLIIEKREQSQQLVEGKERKDSIKNRKEDQIKDLAKKRNTTNIKLHEKIKYSNNKGTT